MFAIWVVSGCLLYPLTDRGTFGDMFGAVNALFSGLAFAGIVYTILLQRRELELQREELRATRAEMSRSATAQEKSEQAIRMQVEAVEYGQRLAAINNMLQFSHECYERLRSAVLDQRSHEQCTRWANRRYELLSRPSNSA